MYIVKSEEILEMREKGFGMHEAKRILKLQKLMVGVDKVPDLETRLILREILSLIT